MSLKRQHCVNCIFSSWYNSFKDITFRSKIIKLTPDFIAYLKKDGVVLPDAEETKYANELERYSDSDEDWNDTDAGACTPCFSLIKQRVKEVINNFGNYKCFMLLNFVLL